ncbi:MAG: hypothetical protein IPH84_17110 [Bacteroidales bacterium]|nr:hypothetical protein [Bacteroidales bacterium]
MTKIAHRIYLVTLSLIVIVALVALFMKGYAYYITSLEERAFHPEHSMLKPSGILGHGMRDYWFFIHDFRCHSLYGPKRYKIFSS